MAKRKRIMLTNKTKYGSLFAYPRRSNGIYVNVNTWIGLKNTDFLRNTAHTLIGLQERQGEQNSETYIPIYKEAEEYGIPWTLLAAHHRIETRFSTMIHFFHQLAQKGICSSCRARSSDGHTLVVGLERGNILNMTRPIQSSLKNTVDTGSMEMETALQIHFILKMQSLAPPITLRIAVRQMVIMRKPFLITTAVINT